MPIPEFDRILNVLPPHVGDPRKRADLSPYPCTVEEVCARFATSEHRVEILQGFLKFRRALLELGVQGFQWVGGSFVEDVEAQDDRVPKDIDVVTFVSEPSDPGALSQVFLKQELPLLNRDYVKATYSVDHFCISLGTAPQLLVDTSRYWYGLFTHRRDRLWKGMLTVTLANFTDDATA